MNSYIPIRYETEEKKSRIAAGGQFILMNLDRLRKCKSVCNMQYYAVLNSD
jgi:hypothetical protein